MDLKGISEKINKKLNRLDNSQIEVMPLEEEVNLAKAIVNLIKMLLILGEEVEDSGKEGTMEVEEDLEIDKVLVVEEDLEIEEVEVEDLEEEEEDSEIEEEDSEIEAVLVIEVVVLVTEEVDLEIDKEVLITEDIKIEEVEVISEEIILMIGIISILKDLNDSLLHSPY